MAEKEYIDRDCVLRSLAVLIQLPFTGLDDAWEVVQKTPTADVAEVRHGRWISHEGYEECNRCGTKAIFQHKYCPNCGADMRGERKEK